MSERMTNWPREIAELKAERDVLREQIQRVREVCFNPETTWRPGEGLGLVRVEAILRALDGGESGE